LPKVVKHLDWEEADDLAEELQQMNQPQQPSPEQQAELEKTKLDIQGKQLDNQKTQIEIMGKVADTKEGQAQTTLEVLKQLGLIPDDK